MQKLIKQCTTFNGYSERRKTRMQEADTKQHERMNKLSEVLVTDWNRNDLNSSFSCHTTERIVRSQISTLEWLLIRSVITCDNLSSEFNPAIFKMFNNMESGLYMSYYSAQSAELEYFIYFIIFCSKVLRASDVVKYFESSSEVLWVSVLVKSGLENRDYFRRGNCALTMWRPSIRKSWH
jgi:hypothetical protein